MRIAISRARPLSPQRDRKPNNSAIDFAVLIVLVWSVLLLLLMTTASAQSEAQDLSSDSRQKVIKKQAELEFFSMQVSTDDGSVPWYKVTIYVDQRLIFEGRGKNDRSKTVVAQITEEQMEGLLHAIKTAKFHKFRPSYSTAEDGCIVSGSHGLWFILTLKQGAEAKAVRHYSACYQGNRRFSRELRRIKLLEERLQAIINIEQWIGTVEERRKLTSELPPIHGDERKSCPDDLPSSQRIHS